MPPSSHHQWNPPKLLTAWAGVFGPFGVPIVDSVLELQPGGQSWKDSRLPSSQPSSPGPTSGFTQMAGKLGCGPRLGAPPADKTQEVGKTLRAHREIPLPPAAGAAGGSLPFSLYEVAVTSCWTCIRDCSTGSQDPSVRLGISVEN